MAGAVKGTNKANTTQDRAVLAADPQTRIMTLVRYSHLLIGLAMLAAAVLALAMTPRLKLAELGPEINLETMIPERFGEWRQENALQSLVVSPDVQTLLNKIYKQTLTRNYVNDRGEQVMLSIALGDYQTRAKQVHRPESCYVGQGFAIKRMSKGFIDVGGTPLPVMKMLAIHGQRIEPVTYWTMIGGSAVRGYLEQNLAITRYGMTGQIPVGIVIRVSMISENEAQSYRTQELFVRDMLAAVPRKYRNVLAGGED